MPMTVLAMQVEEYGVEFHHVSEDIPELIAIR